MYKKETLRVIRVLSLIIFAISLSACTIWNTRQWEELADRSFHFNKFDYYLKGGDRQTAFEFMRGFPLDETLAVLGDKYSITIDSSEFRSFVEDEQNEKKLSAFGVLLKERFSWKSETEHQNTVEFEYANEFVEDSTDTIRRYSVALKTRGKARAIFSDTLNKHQDVPSSLAKKAG